MKQKLTIFLSAAVGIILVGVWLYLVDFGEMLDVFQKVKIFLFFPLALLFILTYFLRCLRWKIILSPVEKISVGESFHLGMSNYFINFIIPVHAGELVKSILLKKMKGTPISKSIMSVYMDKISDVLLILLLLIIAPFIQKQIKPFIYMASLTLLLILFFLGLTFIFIYYKRRATSRLIEKIFFFLPIKLENKLQRFFTIFEEGLSSIFFLPKKLIEIMGLTILALITHCIFMWLFFFSFGVSLPVLTVIVGYLLLNASFILPAPPGFSGSLELTFIFIFSYLYDYDLNLVSAIAASSHIFIATLFGLFGVLALALIGTKLTTVLRAEQ